MALKTKRFGGEGKVYRALATTSYVGIFVAAGIIVASLVNPSFGLNPTIWGLIFTIGLLSLGIISSLPWVRKLEKGEYKKLSIIFIIFVAVTVVLWLICVWLVIIMINTENPDKMLWFLQFVKITIIVSLQFMVATVVGNLWTKVKNTMIPFQAITYASYGFVDFYFSFLLFCIDINPTNSANPVSIDTKALGALGSSWMITILVIALVYTAISNFIVKRMEAKIVMNMAADKMADMVNGQNGADESAAQPVASAPAEKTMEGELTSLKDMLDKGLITEDEYAEARKNIIAKYTK